ncbi:MAG TPA: hypothetical protein VKR54_04725 [Candidatus Babeliales bacterium]|jgi:hypothetical protein|nr:hypothetical protein [Candidatus Babeliales bacterium]
MKNYKGILSIIALLCVNNGFAGMTYQQRAIQLPTVSFSLRSILDGILGSEYASKVREIYSYNDTKARQRGDHSLMGKLNDAITSANANPSPQMKVMQLKTAIADIYNNLLTYRMRDNAPVNPQQNFRPLPAPAVPTLAPFPPSAPISFQNILNGTLGEPYTSKANEIYNSNVPFYVNALVNDINGALNSYYPDESKRVTAIKFSIDRNYNFLNNYRKSNQVSAEMNRPQSVRPLPSVPAPAPVASLSLQSILNGALGEPYTSKANEIYNSNVSVYVNALVNDINGVVNSYYSDESKRISAIKLFIDRDYNNYRRSNQVSVEVSRPQSVRPLPSVPASAPSASLSLQSILNGALGEPYTSKANAIYNSNVSVYVNALVNDINGAVNSYYPNEAKRMSAIKLSIDRNHKFLESYRRSNE